MKMPTTILSIILAVITLTSVNATIPNQSGPKLSSISPGTISAAMSPEDIPGDIQPLSNDLVDAPSAYLRADLNSDNNIDIDDCAIVLL